MYNNYRGKAVSSAVSSSSLVVDWADLMCWEPELITRLHRLALLSFMSRQETDFLQEVSQYASFSHFQSGFPRFFFFFTPYFHQFGFMQSLI